MRERENEKARTNGSFFFFFKRGGNSGRDRGEALSGSVPAQCGRHATKNTLLYGPQRRCARCIRVLSGPIYLITSSEKEKKITRSTGNGYWNAYSRRRGQSRPDIEICFCVRDRSGVRKFVHFEQRWFFRKEGSARKRLIFFYQLLNLGKRKKKSKKILIYLFKNLSIIFLKTVWSMTVILDLLVLHNYSVILFLIFR